MNTFITNRTIFHSFTGEKQLKQILMRLSIKEMTLQRMSVERRYNERRFNIFLSKK